MLKANILCAHSVWSPWGAGVVVVVVVAVHAQCGLFSSKELLRVSGRVLPCQVSVCHLCPLEPGSKDVVDSSVQTTAPVCEMKHFGS